MKTWECEDKETGEVFFVEAQTRQEAREIAKMYFESPVVYGEVSDYEAEMLGYDTY